MKHWRWSTLTPHCCPIWPLSVTLDHVATVTVTQSPLPRLLITAMATNLSASQPAAIAAQWLCLHMLTTLSLVTNTISDHYICSYCFFIRTLLYSLHPKLRNDVECNDEAQTVPIIPLKAWHKSLILLRDCHGQDIPDQCWAPVLVFHLNGVSW